MIRIIKSYHINKGNYNESISQIIQLDKRKLISNLENKTLDQFKLNLHQQSKNDSKPSIILLNDSHLQLKKRSAKHPMTLSLWWVIIFLWEYMEHIKSEQEILEAVYGG